MLKGKTALVTGSTSGIGLGIAHAFAAQGANIVLNGFGDAAEIESLRVALARTHGVTVRYDGADMSRADSIEAMMRRALEEFGAVDILVNNAGIYPMVPLRELDVETFRRVLDVNLTGLFLCTKAVSEQMIARGGGGRIINITSIDALHPSMVGLAHYDASKHGAWGFTKNTALELAPHGIWVNAIAPGGILTPGTGEVKGPALERFEAMIPMGRMGDPDDIGRAALFLASDLSSYMTGSQIVVDGGRLLA